MGDSSMPSLLPSIMPFENFRQDNLPSFVKPLEEKYLCVSCNNLLKPPIKQTPCGHRVCDGCIPEMFGGENEEINCPGNEEDCVRLKKNELTPDRATQREILGLEVFCSNRDKGCAEKMTLKQLSAHSQICQYRETECRNEGCSTMVRASDLEEHLASCEFTLDKCDICGKYIARKDMKEHRTKCVEEPIQCVLYPLGCDFMAKPGTHKEHLIECIQTHSAMIVTAVTEHRKTQDETKITINGMQELVSNLQTTIQSFEQNSKGHKEIESMQRTIAKLGDELNAVKQRITNTVTESQLQENITQIANLKLVTSSNESRIGHLEQNTRNGANANAPSDVITKLDNIERNVGLHDVRFAEADLRFRLLETAAFNGRLIWRIPNYSRRKQDAIDRRTVSLYSQPFYTSYYGYKMCARTYLNGDGIGKGSHLSLFFVLMRGEYDPLLQWPFRQRVTLSILDQSGNRKHITDTFRPDPTSTSFRKPIGEMNIASGSPMFATHAKVEGDAYLKDDTIFIAISVDTTDLQPPWA